MLRATSEIAVASSVWSVLVRSTFAASSRARWRAVTTSLSDSIVIRSSGSGATVGRPLLRLEQREPLLEVERGLHVLEVHPELRHHVVAQLQDVGVGEGRLDRGDQERALLEDRYGHAGLPQLAVFDRVRP